MATATAQKPATTKSRKATTKSRATVKTTKKNVAPRYGGVVGRPDLGANGRRLIQHLRSAHPKMANKVLQNAIKATPDGDRFVRWETIAAEATKLGIDGVNVTLVRKLARADGAADLGRDGSVYA